MNSRDRPQFSLYFRNLLGFLENLIRKNIIDWKVVIIYEKNLTDIPNVNTKIEVNVKRASLNDVKKMMHAKNKNLLSKRLSDGHLCFIAERKGDIAGYCWVAFRELYISEIGRKVRFDDLEACVYDSFVYRGYRRKRIFQKMLVQIFRFLKEKGHRKTFINVLSTNTPSQRGVENVGFKSRKKVAFFKLFGFKKYAETGVSKNETERYQ